MNVLLTGGTGFVGREVLRGLFAAGHRVRLLARRPSAAAPRAAGVEFHSGDILNPTILRGAFVGTDAVIHLVGIISEAGASTFENVHTRGTQNVADAARRAGVRRFLQMSALGARPGAVARYHRSKWAAEEIIRGSGLDFTIFRPSIIYGPGDGFVNLFARMARFSPVLPVMGPGKNKMQPIPVADVAKCLVGALSAPGSIGQSYDLCGREILTFDQILDAILQVTGRRRWKLHLPMGVARLQAACLEFLFAKLLRRAPPLNRDQLLMLQEDNVGNPAAAIGLFGLQPTPFREGIAAWLAPGK